MSKKFWQSKTFWFNLLAFVVAVASSFGFTAEMDESWAQLVVPVVFAINILLRFLTKVPVTR